MIPILPEDDPALAAAVSAYHRADPRPWFEVLRARGPVVSHRGVILVTGHPERRWGMQAYPWDDAAAAAQLAEFAALDVSLAEHWDVLVLQRRWDDWQAAGIRAAERWANWGMP